MRIVIVGGITVKSNSHTRRINVLQKDIFLYLYKKNYTELQQNQIFIYIELVFCKDIFYNIKEKIDKLNFSTSLQIIAEYLSTRQMEVGCFGKAYRAGVIGHIISMKTDSI